MACMVPAKSVFGKLQPRRLHQDYLKGKVQSLGLHVRMLVGRKSELRHMQVTFATACCSAK